VFAPKIAKPQTKVTEGPTSGLALERSTLAGRGFGHNPIEQALFLQKTIGNQATMRLLAQRASRPDREIGLENMAISRERRGLSRDFSKIPVFPPERASQAQPSFSPPAAWFAGTIQAKLEVGAVDDPLEREVEQVAEQVMHMPDAVAVAPPAVMGGGIPGMQRKCSCGGRCAKCRDEQAEAETDFSRIPLSAPALSGVGNCQTLPSDILGDTRRQFGFDFSATKLYASEDANASADGLGAKAYTVGSNIVFGSNRYQPFQSSGRTLIAHELTHVVQQSSESATHHMPDSQSEAEAKTASSAFAEGSKVNVRSRTLPFIAFDRTDDSGDDYQDDDYQDEQANVRKDRSLSDRRTPSKSPESTAQDVKSEIMRMVDDAKAGKFSSASIRTKQGIMKRFYELRKGYRSDEMAYIDRELQKSGLSKASRVQLMKNKKGITAERSRLQGQLDEGMRTPRGQNVTAQKEMIRGGEAHAYHETRPRVGSFTKPDYSVTATSEVGGRIRVHVNLKSHNLTDLRLAEAKAIAREVIKQAIKNAYGSQIKPKVPRTSLRAKTGDVGHLPENDRIIIDFIDQPAPEIQEAMAEVMLAEGSPVVEVRFGTAAFAKPANEFSPGGAGNSQLPKPPLATPDSQTSKLAPAVERISPFELKTTNAPPTQSAPAKISTNETVPVEPTSNVPVEAGASVNQTESKVNSESNPGAASKAKSAAAVVEEDAKAVEGTIQALKRGVVKASGGGPGGMGGWIAVAEGVQKLIGVVGTVFAAIQAREDFERGDYFGAALNTGVVAGLVLPAVGEVAAPAAAAWEGTKAVAELAVWEGQCRVLVNKFETETINQADFEKLAANCPAILIGNEEVQRVFRTWSTGAFPSEW
jgi:hypothetical protein